MNRQTNSSEESPLDIPSDPPAKKRKCHDSIDTSQLVRFSHEMQEITSEELLAKISQLLPIVDDIKSGKVSRSLAKWLNSQIIIGVRMYQLQ